MTKFALTTHQKLMHKKIEKNHSIKNNVSEEIQTESYDTAEVEEIHDLDVISLSDDENEEIEQFDTISEETLVPPKKIINVSTEIKSEAVVQAFEDKTGSDVQSSSDKNGFDIEPLKEKSGSQIQPIKIK